MCIQVMPSAKVATAAVRLRVGLPRALRREAVRQGVACENAQMLASCGGAQSGRFAWREHRPLAAGRRIAERDRVRVDPAGLVESQQRAEHRHGLVALRPVAQELVANAPRMATAGRSQRTSRSSSRWSLGTIFPIWGPIAIACSRSDTGA